MFILMHLAGCGAQYLTLDDARSPDAQRASDNWADQDTDGVGTHRVVADGLNVRDAAAAVIGIAERDQQLVLTGASYESGGYTYLEAVFKGSVLDGTVGWVAAAYLAFSELEVCNGSGVSLRSPADLGQVVDTADAGEALYVTSRTVRNTGSHRYFLGKVGGLEAYVATDFLCAPGAGSGAGSTGNLAADVLARHDAGTTVLWDQTFGRLDGASPLDNIRDAAAGRPALTSCYGGAPCSEVFLSTALLEGMLGLSDDYGYDTFVTTIAGAAHSSSSSLHYFGRAVDVDEINGVRVLGDSQRNRDFMNACWDLGAVEVFGPSNDPYGHYDHIHCAW
jgi:hypothetical protein